MGSDRPQLSPNYHQKGLKVTGYVVTVGILGDAGDGDLDGGFDYYDDNDDS